jgi:putative DNA primase/helicase
MHGEAQLSMNTPAEQIIRALGGHRVGTGWVAHCPAHNDRHPSLSIDVRGGKVLFCCHAGCSQAALMAALRARGLWGRGQLGAASIRAPEQQHDTKADEASDRRRSEMALRIWAETRRPAVATPVEQYLQARGITIPPPNTLSFHPALRHPSGDVWPAMVALVTRGSDGKPVGIHRTFLCPDGRGKAPVDRQKMMLGRCRGGAVRLGPATHLLMIAEGIETALSAMQATGRPTWAALSTSGLRSLDLPPVVREVFVLADGDDNGESAAKTAALRWRLEGRRVRIARPPAGVDFNDVLKGLGPEGEYDC